MGDEPSKFSVAIVGGGICGLLCAIGLNRAGIRVDLFEAAAKYGEVGAGVAIGPNAVRVLKAFGVLDEVISHSGEDGPTMKSFNYIFGTGENDFIYHYPAREDDEAIAVHRASFLEALIGLLNPSLTTSHFLKRCISVNSSESTRSVLHFSDGTTHETDLVIGADGIRSTVRQAVVGAETAANSLVYTNTVAYRGLVPLETLKALGVKTEVSPFPIEWTGHNRHIVTFPIKKFTVLNVVAFVCDNTLPLGSVTLAPGTPWVTPVPQQELLDAYAGWGEDPLKILSCIKSPSKWSIFALHPPLESYVKGKVALVGDAAHGMLPHLGAGVGQGIEDTWVLTQLLTRPETNLSNLEDVLKTYDQLRVPRANFVLKHSIRAGRIYEGFGESGSSAEGIKKDLDMMYEKVWHHDLEGEVRAAVQHLRDEGVFVSQGHGNGEAGKKVNGA